MVNKTDILNIINEIRTHIDEIGINTEILEANNRLIYDKLETIEEISKKRNQTLEQTAMNLWEIERNNECYMTLSYVITSEIQKIDNTVQDIHNKLKVIDDFIQNQ